MYYEIVARNQRQKVCPLETTENISQGKGQQIQKKKENPVMRFGYSEEPKSCNDIRAKALNQRKDIP